MTREFEIWLDLKTKLLSYQIDLRHYSRVRGAVFGAHSFNEEQTETVIVADLEEYHDCNYLIDSLEREIYKLKQAIDFVNNPGWLLRYYKDVHQAQRTVSNLLGMQVDVQSTILFPQQGEEMRTLYELAKADYFNTLKQLED